mgnify:FL=1
MKPTININGEIFETEWDDPLLIEESLTVENSKAICHFFDIENCINSEEEFFAYLLR